MPPTCSPAVALHWHWCALADQTCQPVRAARRRWTGLVGGGVVATCLPSRRCCVRLCHVSRCGAPKTQDGRWRGLALVARHVGCWRSLWSAIANCVFGRRFVYEAAAGVVMGGACATRQERSRGCGWCFCKCCGAVALWRVLMLQGHAGSVDLRSLKRVQATESRPEHS
jgi:hypothetical protein